MLIRLVIGLHLFTVGFFVCYYFSRCILGSKPMMRKVYLAPFPPSGGRGGKGL